ncbi:MAG: PAS domain-containing sensor histidine kinase [Salinivirgaceae bacterium]|jgi:PAS domain S-box-containing protein|nr:PAS domain-containing sensor histidine kinase [Salinivirgaceae bacterium]
MTEKLSYKDLEKELANLKAQNAILIQENRKLKINNEKSESTYLESNTITNKNQPSDENLLYILMNTMPDRIYFKDAHSRFIKISKSLTQKHGLSNPEDAIGKSDFDYFTQEHAHQAFLDEQKILDSGEPLKNIEEKETWNDGSITWASTTKMPIINKNNKIVGTFGISRDITEFRATQLAIQESEFQLRELNATKDKFFSIIAHDLMNPICTILGFSQLLTKNFNTYNEQKNKEMVHVINEGIEKTFNLLENLLLWSRNQRGFVDFKTKNENLYQLSLETLDLLNQSAKNKSIRLINKIKEHFIINVDKNMLQTILRNLISNAIKFTPNGGRIIIDANLITDASDHNFIEVSVKDSGVGIAKDMQAKLFKITDSISTKGTENESGTGLGLILCKEFVEKHKGEIRVESEEGKGSMFIISIPNPKEEPIN